jgi:hypothetical protein
MQEVRKRFTVKRLASHGVSVGAGFRCQYGLG